MKAVRIYKISIRENILRQVIFTDKNIFFTFCFCLILVLWKLFSNFPVDFKLFLSVLACGVFLIIISVKIDRQPIVYLVGRIFIFIFSKKKVRG